MAVDLQKRTAHFIRDLHARESMRLGWYRQWSLDEDQIRYLRERKAKHEAFLKDLLRRRGLSPAWYARLFYIAGNIFGWISAFFPEKLMAKIEKTLEFWVLLRYKNHHRKMKLDFNLRSMVESVQLRRLSHDEPGPDVLKLLEEIIREEEQHLQLQP